VNPITPGFAKPWKTKFLRMDTVATTRDFIVIIRNVEFLTMCICPSIVSMLLEEDCGQCSMAIDRKPIITVMKNHSSIDSRRRSMTIMIGMKQCTGFLKSNNTDQKLLRNDRDPKTG
jgi:hypothetical protein